VSRARTAYEQKRTKECIELTKQVLLADSENAEAKALHAAVLSDIQRDLIDARALLEDAKKMEDGQKYRKAAEIILLKILYLDPSHAEAKDLLSGSKSTAPRIIRRDSEIRSLQVVEREVRPRVEEQPRSLPRTETQPWSLPRIEDQNRTLPLIEEEIAFTAQPQPVEVVPQSSGVNLKIPLIAAAVVLLAVGLWFLLPYISGSAEPEPPVAVSNNAKPPEKAPSPIPSFRPTPTPVIEVKAKNEPPAVPSAPEKEPVTPPVTNSAPKPAAVKETGSLAVNSPVATDIYMGDKYLGATPTTLQLPPGRHTIEYRHNDLRAVMTHEVKARETTSAFVTFEITVQLNARPWAQVFVEGSARRALGQTPLSSVRVPIGSLLTFENPNFPPKSHRVTESDAAIQMVFQ
jgi:hypothetical protein